MPLIADNPYGFTIENKAAIPNNIVTDMVNTGAAWDRPQCNWYPYILTSTRLFRRRIKPQPD